MNMPSPSAAATRSELLEKYLREDPANPNLLADACEAAITAGQYERALAHMQAAEALALDPPAWTFRRARMCIAQRDLAQAEALLERLRAERGDDAVISHDLAFVRFLQSDFAACRQLLVPWLATNELADQPLPAERFIPRPPGSGGALERDISERTLPPARRRGARGRGERRPRALDRGSHANP